MGYMTLEALTKIDTLCSTASGVPRICQLRRKCREAPLPPTRPAVTSTRPPPATTDVTEGVTPTQVVTLHLGCAYGMVMYSGGFGRRADLLLWVTQTLVPPLLSAGSSGWKDATTVSACFPGGQGGQKWAGERLDGASGQRPVVASTAGSTVGPRWRLQRGGGALALRSLSWVPRMLKQPFRHHCSGVCRTALSLASCRSPPCRSHSQQLEQSGGQVRPQWLDAPLGTLLPLLLRVPRHSRIGL